MNKPPPPTQTAAATPEAVLEFLAGNPDFLIRHGLAGPAGSDRVVPLGQALIKRAGDVIRAFDSTRSRMADIHDANVENTERVHQAACMLMAAGSPMEVVATVRDHLPDVLAVRAARLVFADDGPLSSTEGCLGMDRTGLAALTRDGDHSLGPANQAQRRLWEGVVDPLPESTAYATLPAVLPGRKSQGVLALAGETADSFREDDATDLLTFLAGLIAIALIARSGAEGPR